MSRKEDGLASIEEGNTMTDVVMNGLSEMGRREIPKVDLLLNPLRSRHFDFESAKPYKYLMHEEGLRNLSNQELFFVGNKWNYERTSLVREAPNGKPLPVPGVEHQLVVHNDAGSALGYMSSKTFHAWYDFQDVSDRFTELGIGVESLEDHVLDGMNEWYVSSNKILPSQMEALNEGRYVNETLLKMKRDMKQLAKKQRVDYDGFYPKDFLN